MLHRSKKSCNPNCGDDVNKTKFWQLCLCISNNFNFFVLLFFLFYIRMCWVLLTIWCIMLTRKIQYKFKAKFISGACCVHRHRLQTDALLYLGVLVVCLIKKVCLYQCGLLSQRDWRCPSLNTYPIKWYICFLSVHKFPLYLKKNCENTYLKILW